jgi:hypothetical protein
MSAFEFDSAHGKHRGGCLHLQSRQYRSGRWQLCDMRHWKLQNGVWIRRLHGVSGWQHDLVDDEHGADGMHLQPGLHGHGRCRRLLDLRGGKVQDNDRIGRLHVMFRGQVPSRRRGHIGHKYRLSDKLELGGGHFSFGGLHL